MTPAQRELRELRLENEVKTRHIEYLNAREAESDAPCETTAEYRRRLTALRAHIGRIGRDIQRAGDALVRLGEEERS